MNDVIRYANEKPAEFFEAVESNKLFVAPGGTVDEPLTSAIARYKGEIQKWRSAAHVSMLNKLTDAEFVCNGIFERLEPQFHLVENANELRAQPLLAMPAQAHYFSVCASAVEHSLVENEVISLTTRTAMKALSEQRFERLGNVPIDSIIEMRRKNENEQFRSALADALKPLNNTSLDDLDRVSSEMAKQIGSLLNKHQADARRINDVYKTKYRGLAAGGLLTLGAFAIPFLAPLLGTVAPLVLTSQYAQTKLAERREKQELASSLVGILAEAEEAQDAIE